MKEREIRISEIAKILELDYIGKDLIIDGLNLCNRPTKYNSIVSYITSEKYLNNVVENKSICGLFLTQYIYENFVSKIKFDRDLSFMIAKYPEVTFYNLHTKLYNETCFYNKYDFKTQLGENCIIHNTTAIADGVIIGDNVKIGANSVIKKGTIINDNTTIGSCSVIGSEGFQLIFDEYNIPFTVIHTGGTYIGKNVLINDNCTVCNSLFEGNVIIEDNCKIDNHVHIGHNCKIGINTVITGNSLLMGSVELKENVWIAPSSTISNKCIVNQNSFVGAMSLIVNNIPEKSRVCGIPAIPIDDYIRMIVQQKKLIQNARKNIENNKPNQVKQSTGRG